jgi:hypothetical protein
MRTTATECTPDMMGQASDEDEITSFLPYPMQTNSPDLFERSENNTSSQHTENHCKEST